MSYCLTPDLRETSHISPPPLPMVFPRRLSLNCLALTSCRVMPILASWQRESTPGYMQEPISLQTPRMISVPSISLSANHFLPPDTTLMPCDTISMPFWAAEKGPLIDSGLLCRNRFIFVNTDACMAAQGVTLGVMEKLKVASLDPTCNEIWPAHTSG